MVHGVCEPVVAGLPPNDDAAFARSLGYGRDSSQAAQRGVVAPSQGIPSLCKQRGEDDPSYSRQGCEELHVMLLCLPWLDLCRGNEFCGQGVELAIRYFELPIHKADARNKARYMRAGGFSRSGGDLQRRFAQHVQYMRGAETPDTIAFQDLATVASRMRLALAGVGANSHRSSSQAAPRSLSRSSMTGK